MPRRTIVVLAMAAMIFLGGCGPAIHASFVLADASGYRVKSPCGEVIATVEVVQSLSPTTVEVCWRAVAHEESGANEIRLFEENPGYTSSRVAGPLDPSGDYIVEVNGVRGSSFVPKELSPGRGVWLIDTFDVSDLAKEQRKVDKLLGCTR